MSRRPQLALLLQREINGRTSKQHYFAQRKEFFATVPSECVYPIEHLISRNHQLFRCTLLGFTKDGNYLVSYNYSNIEDISEGGDLVFSKRNYQLQFWKFDASRLTVTKVADISLFANHSFCCNTEFGLELTVIESSDESLFIVHGSEVSQDVSGSLYAAGMDSEEQSTKQNYVTIFASPIRANQHNIPSSGNLGSLHFSYEFSAPHPRFQASTSFLPPNTLILNTGNSIQCIEFSILQQCIYNNTGHSMQQIDYNPFDFSLSNMVHTRNTTNPYKLSKIHRWPFPQKEALNAVQFEENDVTTQSHPQSQAVQISSHDAFSCETYLLTMGKKLPLLKDTVLIDYDLQVVEVIESDQVVLLFVLAKFRPKNQLDAHLQKHICFLLLLHLESGNVEALRITEAHPNSGNRKVLTQAINNAINDLRRVRYVPKNPLHTVYSLNNQSVFTGSSLPFICHPLLPIAIQGFKQQPTSSY